jgi:nicotinate-nucleotide--dimethylbenzimidazole phosphoribosyltransferase
LYTRLATLDMGLGVDRWRRHVDKGNAMTAAAFLQPLDPALLAKLEALVAGKAKPPGSLGRIEDLAVQIGAIQQRADPRIERALLLLFAGDHGFTAEGVSSYPASVTPAMVRTLAAGRASANAFARAVGAELRVVDAGVAADLSAVPGIVHAKIGAGTRNAMHGPAMSREEAERAFQRGEAFAVDAAREGFDLLAIGEMGIGNSASAALLMHRLASAPLPLCVGRGAGQTDEGLARKLAVLTKIASRSAATEPMEVLAEFGGFEIAMMAGAVFGAARARRPMLVDGFIASAAALTAIRLDPIARQYCIFAHRSAEAGHDRMLEALDAKPLLDLELRLGEGTGAALAIPLARAAARLLADVATLDEVVSGSL